jgi:hypothetical protein
MHGCYEKDLLANPCHPVHQSGMLWLPQRWKTIWQFDMAGNLWNPRKKSMKT